MRIADRFYSQCRYRAINCPEPLSLDENLTLDSKTKWEDVIPDTKNLIDSVNLLDLKQIIVKVIDEYFGTSFSEYTDHHYSHFMSGYIRKNLLMKVEDMEGNAEIWT